MKATSRGLYKRRRRSRMRTALRIFRRALLYTVITTGGALLITPFLWMVSTSLKPLKQIYIWPPVWIPNPIDWQNYPEAWGQQPWGLFYKNTSIITASCIVGILFSCSLAAYAFARLRLPGNHRSINFEKMDV